MFANTYECVYLCHCGVYIVEHPTLHHTLSHTHQTLFTRTIYTQQVRATGAVDPVIYQPIKGRKVGGGIRFGEMERDSLLAHGAAYLLHDRLHSSSDYKPCFMCNACGSLLSPTWVPHATPKGMEHMVGHSGGMVVMLWGRV